MPKEKPNKLVIQDNSNHAVAESEYANQFANVIEGDAEILHRASKENQNLVSKPKGFELTMKK